MDLQDRAKRVEALDAIKKRAVKMAVEGEDAFSVRDFISKAREELAYQLPDEEAFRKAVSATKKFKGRSSNS